MILTPGLFPNHTLPRSDQTAIFQLRTSGDVNPFQFPAPQTPGQFAAIGWIPLRGSLFIRRRNIRRIGHDTVHSLVPKLVMSPKTAKTGLINRMIGRSGKIAFKIMEPVCPFSEVG